MSDFGVITDTDTIKIYENGEMKDIDATVVNECHFAVFLSDSYYKGLMTKDAFTQAMNGKCLILTDIMQEHLKEFAFGYCAANADFEPEDIADYKEVVIDDETAVAIVFVDNLTVETRGPREDHYLAYTTNQKSNIAISPQKIINEMRAFTKRSELFSVTGCVHGAEIFDGTTAIKFVEDINKMNAVYKIIGHALVHGIDLSSCVVFSTGRVFKEMVKACDAMGCHIIVSKSAPTRQAIELAMEKDMTLIGFAREDSFKIYCGESRIMI